jgi:hypothetical protein
VEEVLPALFHDTPEAFLNLLNRDGTRFLYFYWAEAAKKLPQEQGADPFGLNYVIRKPGPRPDFILVLLTLPEPANPGEAFFSALAYRPYRRLLLVTDITAVFNLEMDEPEGETPQTCLVQWTRRDEREVVRRGVDAGIEGFYSAVLAELQE